METTQKISGFFCKARHYISLKVLRTLSVILRASLSLSTLRKYHMGKNISINTRTNKKATKENYKNDNIFRIYRSHYPLFFKSYQFFPQMRYTKEKHHCLCFDTLIICFQWHSKNCLPWTTIYTDIIQDRQIKFILIICGQILTLNIPLNTEAVRYGTIFQHMSKALNQYISLGRNQRIPGI